MGKYLNKSLFSLDTTLNVQFDKLKIQFMLKSFKLFCKDNGNLNNFNLLFISLTQKKISLVFIAHQVFDKLS